MSLDGWVIVDARVVGQSRGLNEVDVPLAPGRHPLRVLLEGLVRAELVTSDQRQRERSVLRVLTPADLARGVESGRYLAEARHRQSAPTFAEVWSRAQEAFTDELYVVFVDDQQVTELDAEVEVRPGSRMRLIRLVALAGG